MAVRTETELHALLDELTREHGMPGAVVGVLEHDEVVVAASGSANLRSGVAMTADTVYLLGSITKTWVGTLVMRLVDEHALVLDAPVREYLPDFRLADEDAAAAITLRHLLTHSSGIDAGDYIVDLGRDPDSVAAYVDTLADKGMLHDPGRWASYNNAGFVIAGRIIEVVTGLPFDRAITALLFEPLGLERTGLTADHAVLNRAAIGHFPPPQPGEPSQPTPEYMLPYCMGPAGTTLVTCAEDVLRFARLHLAGGRTEAGEQLLRAETVDAMTEHQAALPAPEGVGFGITWGRSEVDGTLMLSHGGGSNGGRTRLTLVPAHGLAVTVFANHSQSDAFVADLLGVLLQESIGATPAPSPPPEPFEVDLSRLAGTYAKWGLAVHVEPDGDELVLRFDSTQPGWSVYAAGSASMLRGRMSDPRTLVSGAGPAAAPIHFIDPDDDGRPTHLFMHARLARRTA